MKELICQFAIVTMIGLTASPLFAVDTYWNTYIGDWSSNSNWNNAEPASTVNAYIDNGGTAQITNANNEFCYAFTVGYDTGSSGTLDAINGSLSCYSSFVGYQGIGTLNIFNSSTVNASNTTEIGVNAGGAGIINVDGLGSALINSGSANIGVRGNGTLNVRNGGTVSSSAGSIATYAGATGVVNVNGSGSKWNSNNYGLSIGQHGNGTLNITNGGAVTSTNSYIGHYSDATGLVEIQGSGSTWINKGRLRVGLLGSGALDIGNGGIVRSEYCEIGYQGSSVGTVTVDGSGSILTTSRYFDIGVGSYGSLNVSGGGSVSNTFSRIGYLGSDYNQNGTGEVHVNGVGSIWTLTQELYVGYSGKGSMNITNGGTVNSQSGRIADSVGSNGSVTISGAGSEWTINDSLSIGYQSSGTLNITNGGQVNVGTTTWMSRLSTGSGRINFNNGILTTGDLIGSADELSGTGTINTNGLVSDIDLVFNAEHGSNQTFTINKYAGQNVTVNLNANGLGQIGAGNKGVGTMTICDGVKVSSTNGLIGIKKGSKGTVNVDGTASAWTNSGYINVGVSGSGTLDVKNGGQLKSNGCEIGTYSGSSGVLTVNGYGSVWTNTWIAVGSSGSGALNINNGGKVINTTNSFIGHYAGSAGIVTVDGAGSRWNTNSTYIGREGTGTLNILHGGLVKASYLYIDYYTKYNSFINMDSGGMLALYGNGSSSITNFLKLVYGTDAIRYWDHSLSNWRNITYAAYGKDYTLAYMTQGDLAGYTVLTVIPEPGTLLMLGLGGLLLRKRKLQP